MAQGNQEIISLFFEHDGDIFRPIEDKNFFQILAERKDISLIWTKDKVASAAIQAATKTKPTNETVKFFVLMGRNLRM